MVTGTIKVIDSELMVCQKTRYFLCNHGQPQNGVE